MKINADDAAFARPQSRDVDGFEFATFGLTKREHFAALAMQGLCASSIPGNHHGFQNLAAEAVQYADALIAELHKAKP